MAYNFARGTFETSLGTAEFALLNWNLVKVRSGGTADNTPGLRLNGKLYSVELALRRTMEESEWAQYYSDLGVMRAHEAVGMAPADEESRKAITDEISSAWNGFISGKDSLLLQAEIHAIERRIEYLRRNAGSSARERKRAEKDLKELLNLKKAAEEKAAQFRRRGGYPNPEDWDPR